jgi:hypothetical protein
MCKAWDVVVCYMLNALAWQALSEMHRKACGGSKPLMQEACVLVQDGGPGAVPLPAPQVDVQGLSTTF